MGPLSRSLLGTAALGVVARLAAWPLFFVGARALAPARFATVGLLFAVAFTALGLAKTRRAAVVSSVVVAVAGFGAAGAAATAMGLPPLPAVAGALVAIGAAGAFFRATLAHLGTTLDARATALAPVGLWVSSAALQARFGAEAVHLHGLVTTLSSVLAIIGVLLAALGVATTTSLRSWIRTVRIGPIPADEAPPPKLSDVEPCEAAIVEADGEGPYRTPSRGAFALVPTSRDVLVTRYGRLRASSSAILVVAAATTALLASHAPRAAHATATDDSPFAALPPRPRLSGIVFVPTEGLTMVDIDAVASRYSRVTGLFTRVDPPLRLDPALYDARRGQLIAEDVLARTMARPITSESFFTIVVTDHDMFLRRENWRYAFAARNGGTGAIVSVARMAADFPWDAPASHERHRPACTKVLDERMHKMITRSLLFSRYEVVPSREPDSILRPSILSLADLDAVDERRF